MNNKLAGSSCVFHLCYLLSCKLWSCTNTIRCGSQLCSREQEMGFAHELQIYFLLCWQRSHRTVQAHSRLLPTVSCQVEVTLTQRQRSQGNDSTRFPHSISPLNIRWHEVWEDRIAEHLCWIQRRTLPRTAAPPRHRQGMPPASLPTWSGFCSRSRVLWTKVVLDPVP